MGKSTTVQLEQICQNIDLLISQLFAFKTTIAELSKNIEGLQSQTKNYELTDAQKATLLNKREKPIRKGSKVYNQMAKEEA